MIPLIESSVNARLKRLRSAAQPSISIREMAEKIGVSHATYHNYERAEGFKGRFLPMDTARRVASVLADRGINPDEVLALAGVGADETASIGLSAGQQQLLDLFDRISPPQRRAVVALVRTMIPHEGKHQ